MAEQGAPYWDQGADAWVVADYSLVHGLLNDPHFDVVPDVASAPAVSRPADRLPSVPEFFSDWFSRSQRHEEVRRILKRPFAERSVLAWQPELLALARELARSLPADGDLVPAYLRPFAVRSTLMVLEAPPEHWEDLGRVAAILNRAINAPAFRPEDVAAVRRCMLYLRAFVERLLATDPQGPLTAALRQVDGLNSGGIWLAVATYGQLLAAGVEPVAAGSALALRELAEHDLLGALADAHESALALSEEALRLHPPFTYIHRWAVSRCDCTGVRIRPGQHVMVDLARIHLDEAVFPEPRRIVANRGRRNNFTYGRGLHACLGMASARYQVAACLQGISEMDNFEIGVIRVSEMGNYQKPESIAFKEIERRHG